MLSARGSVSGAGSAAKRRSRGNFNRTLPPLDNTEQSVVEYLNYGLAFFGIGIVFYFYRRRLIRLNGVYRSWIEGEVA